jgi:hypothetical protein
VGPGTELKRLLAKVGIYPTPECKCTQRATAMDSEGPDWCRENVETIVDWLEEESTRRKLPFVRLAGKLLVLRAIHNTRKKLRMLEHE